VIPAAHARGADVPAGRVGASIRIATDVDSSVPVQRLDAALRALIDLALRRRPAALDSGADNRLCVSTTPAAAGGRRP
jgi:hypothetical protein